jgi:hypothetical protein
MLTILILALLALLPVALCLYAIGVYVRGMRADLRTLRAAKRAKS